MQTHLGKMILNDTKKPNVDFLREILVARPTKRLGVADFLDVSEFINLPGDPEIVPIKGIYTDKLFWLLED